MIKRIPYSLLSISDFEMPLLYCFLKESYASFATPPGAVVKGGDKMRMSISFKSYLISIRWKPLQPPIFISTYRMKQIVILI